MDTYRNVEVATLCAGRGINKQSTLIIHEGHWDDAWVQMVVLTAAETVKSGKDAYLVESI